MFIAICTYNFVSQFTFRNFADRELSYYKRERIEHKGLQCGPYV
jgi:hypothetical protein